MGGETGQRELVLSAMEQATMNDSGITGEGITVYRARTATSGQPVCFHNASNKKRVSFETRQKEGRKDAQADDASIQEKGDLVFAAVCSAVWWRQRQSD